MNRINRYAGGLILVFLLLCSTGVSAGSLRGLNWFPFVKKQKAVKLRRIDDREFKRRLDSLLSFEMAKTFCVSTISELEEGPCFTHVSGGIDIKCDWVNEFEYFGTWDKGTVNPYKVDPLKLKTPVMLELCDKKDSTAWVFPIKKGRITSRFGWRRYRYHYGIDMKLRKGDPVRAAFDGIVRIARYNRGGYGYYVLLRHKNGLETIYGHLSKYIVKSGQEVKAGDLIGYGGSTGRSTGNHLHFELRYQGNPINPAEFYDLEKAELISGQYQIDEHTYAYVKEMRKRVYHRIRRGDYLGRIARRYHTTIIKICRLNRIKSTTTLRIGRRLRVR
ncbi:MAG: peptidoglycan DD-metalloendopeptidase family protein [Cytophagales bacterium]|nr:peptidoglycan DD-metalloendopeptidase family protein [Cytophagales bacterium]